MQQIIYTKEGKIDLPCSVTHQQLRAFPDCSPQKSCKYCRENSLFGIENERRNSCGECQAEWEESFSLLKYVNSIAWPKTFHGKSSEAARQTARQVERQADRQTDRKTDR